MTIGIELANSELFPAASVCIAVTLYEPSLSELVENEFPVVVLAPPFVEYFNVAPASPETVTVAAFVVLYTLFAVRPDTVGGLQTVSTTNPLELYCNVVADLVVSEAEVSGINYRIGGAIGVFQDH